MRGKDIGPLATVAYSTSLPYEPFHATYLNTNPQVIRVAANMPYPSRADTMSIDSTRATYGLMMHMSSSLGVNCTYCHNTQSFRQWSISRPQRANAWYGIRMVRDINVNYIGGLANVFPAYRKGPQGDPNKANCGTCHQGQNKPMGGYPMLSQYPELRGTAATLRPAVYTPATPGAPDGSDMNGPTGGEVATITATIPKGIRALTADASATTQSCNADFAHTLAGHTIEFDTASATIRAAQQAAARPARRHSPAAARRSASRSTATPTRSAKRRRTSISAGTARNRSPNIWSRKASSLGHLAAVGYGESRPKVGGGAAAQENRRIEITVSPPRPAAGPATTTATTAMRRPSRRSAAG